MRDSLRTFYEQKYKRSLIGQQTNLPLEPMRVERSADDRKRYRAEPSKDRELEQAVLETAYRPGTTAQMREDRGMEGSRRGAGQDRDSKPGLREDRGMEGSRMVTGQNRGSKPGSRDDRGVGGSRRSTDENRGSKPGPSWRRPGSLDDEDDDIISVSDDDDNMSQHSDTIVDYRDR